MKTNKIISIALAEDYQLYRKGLRLSINAFKDCAVDMEAENGAQLIEALSVTEKLPDICILDISMPCMDGYETLKHIKSRWPQIKTIMLSMHYNEYAIIKSFRDGANAFLPKEVNDDELQRAILDVYHKGMYHTDADGTYMKMQLMKEGINTNMTEREIDFLRHICGDYSYQQIAELMHVSPRTIDSYRDSLFKKLKVATRSALAVFAIESGIRPISNFN